MIAEEGEGRTNLGDSARPEGGEVEVSTHSADPVGARPEGGVDSTSFSAEPVAAVPELLEKSAQPRAPNNVGEGQASAQPVSALPETAAEPPPADKG